jgi:hypothetical protein
MLGPVRKVVTVAALAGTLAVATATPSQAWWFGRGWGWGAPVAAGIGLGLVGAAIANAAIGSAYYGYGYGYGYPAYSYYGYGYPGYAYSYPGYSTFGYGVSYGYGGWGGYDYGYYTPRYTYGYPGYAVYRVARHAVRPTAFAAMRMRGPQRAYALAPHYRGPQVAHVNRAPSHVVTGRLAQNRIHAQAVKHVRTAAAPAARKAGLATTAHPVRNIRAASASVTATR